MPSQQGNTPEVVMLWRTLRSELKRKASLEGKPSDLPDDMAQEVITLFLEQCREEHIEKPYHWCRLVALRRWVREQERIKAHLSYDGVVDVSVGGDQTAKTTGNRDGQGELDFYRPDKVLKIKVPVAVKRLMVDRVTDNRDPATISEQRDFIRLIDPDWQEHMADGLDYTRGYKLSQRTRDAIRKRARRIQQEVNEC